MGVIIGVMMAVWKSTGREALPGHWLELQEASKGSRERGGERGRKTERRWREGGDVTTLL